EEALELYEIQHTVDMIRSGGYTRVALQFPDELLADSSLVSTLLQNSLPDVCLCTLADTSLGSCCVDEVAASHNGADLIVHYGRTCLSLTSRIPVFYVFGREPIDTMDCVEKMPKGDVLVVCDAPYMYKIGEIAGGLRRRGVGSVVESRFDVPGVYVPGAEKRRPGRVWDLEGRPLSEYNILFVGQESLTLTNILLTQRCRTVFSYDPLKRVLREETMANRHLARRYHMVQRARDADTIGIIVGTQATGYLGLIEALKTLLRRARKKFYVFTVGKLNVAKLANFPEINAYVLVACPENSIVDSKEFFAPVVTPYELLLAVSQREWSGDYVTDFGALLSEIENTSVVEDDDVPHYSLITGKLMQRRHVDAQSSGGEREEESTSLVVGVDREIVRYLGSAGAEYLLSRSFRGLGHDGAEEEEQTEPMVAVEGKSGIARAYAR
ncbi:putative diphthamide synthesis protein-domain-containing protein, partial [Coemansia spiralis]